MLVWGCLLTTACSHRSGVWCLFVGCLLLGMGLGALWCGGRFVLCFCGCGCVSIGLTWRLLLVVF